MGDVRSIGLFGCFELIQNTKTKQPLVLNERNAPHPASVQMGKAMKEKGLFAFQAMNYLHCNPPLTISEEELDEGLAIFDEVLNIADAAVVE